MSAQTTYPKRNLEVIPFSYQLEFIDKVVSSPTKSQHQSSNRYHNNNNNNHHHHHQNQHLHLHQQYQQYLQQQQQQNKYTLAAVAAAAALQQQQQQTFLLQQQQAQQAALAQKKQQQQQQQQKQTQHQHSQLFVNYNSQSPQVFALPTPPQVFGDVPMDKSITNSSMFSSLSQPLNTTGNIDLKTNFMLYNNSTNSIPSPTNSQYGGNGGGGGKQTSASSQSSGGGGVAAAAATGFTTKLFDNSVGSNSNSPILLPPNANRNPSPPNLFLSTNSSNNNNGSPLMGASMTPTSTSFLNNSPSLVTTGPISSNTWSMGVSTPTSGSIWGNKSSGTSTTLTATPITKTSSNVMSSFNGSNLW